MTKLRLVFEVEEETLIKDNYTINKKALNFIAMLLSNFRNSEREVILISAGAIASGMERFGLHEYPHILAEKQALAAIGQVDLIKRYQNVFDEYAQMVAQVLLSRDIFSNPKQQINAKNTFRKLFSLGVIPIINENDTISTADIELEDNYELTATVASIVKAHALISIEEDFSFKIICKGSNSYYHIPTKEELFVFLDSLDYKKNHATLWNYPPNFPTKKM